MNTAIAPPCCALKTFSLKLQVPRSINAILPVSEPAGNGLTSPASEQPRVLLVAAVLTFSPGTIGAGPTVPVAAGPNAALPNRRPVRFAGTGVGAVTAIVPATIVESLDTAPTPITFGAMPGDTTVSV